MRINEQNYGVLYELCSLLFTTLRSPLISIPFGTDTPSPAARLGRPRVPASWGRLPPMSSVGMVSLMLGISLTLMLCGSVTFVIGFMMFPWVLGMVMLLYFFGIVSGISGLCKAVLISLSSSPAPLKTCPKEINGHVIS